MFENIIFFIGFQRNGTSVLRKTISQNLEFIDIGEIFHIKFNRKLNFFNYYYEELIKNPKLITEQGRRKAFEDYLFFLQKRHSDKILLIDVKHNAVGHLGYLPNKRKLYLLDFIQSYKIPSVNIFRNNTFETILSLNMARKTGQWGQKEIRKEINTQVFLNPSKTLLQAQELSEQNDFFRKETAVLPNNYQISYEELIDSDKSVNKDLFNFIAKLFRKEVDDMNREPARPKQAIRSHRAQIENYDEVKKIFSNTPFAWMVE